MKKFITLLIVLSLLIVSVYKLDTIVTTRRAERIEVLSDKLWIKK